MFSQIPTVLWKSGFPLVTSWVTNIPPGVWLSNWQRLQWANESLFFVFCLLRWNVFRTSFLYKKRQASFLFAAYLFRHIEADLEDIQRDDFRIFLVTTKSDSFCCFVGRAVVSLILDLLNTFFSFQHYHHYCILFSYPLYHLTYPHQG